MFCTYTEQEAAERTGFDRHKFPLFRELGMIKGIKTGKGWRYREKDIDEFWETFNGSDMSNAEQIRLTATMWRMKKGSR